MEAPGKTISQLSTERVRQHLQARFNPIRGLTPETLSSYLDSFDLGYLRHAAVLWQKIRERDDTVVSVAAKRELSVSLLNWEILTEDDSPEATAHKEALETFYNGLTATNAIDLNQRGGVSKLVQQMMHAQGHKWAVHEIVWQPKPDGISAEFRFVPLQFFENRTGQLRFLPSDSALDGVDLEAGGWMVTAGAGLMEATSIAYLFKQLPLKDWLIFCEKAGIPALHGKTDAAKGSPEWDEFRDALANFGADWALVTSLAASVESVDLKAQGQLPHPPLVDRMDRAIARMWRGADLGTMAKDGSAVGANPQDGETDILEAADAMLISETLQHYVDRWVIRYLFGTEPLAYFELQPTVKLNQETELKVDEALIKWGVPRGQRELLARYGRPEIEEGDEPAKAAPAPTPFGAPGQPRPAPAPAVNPLANESRASAFSAAAMAQYAPAVRTALAPLASRLQQIGEITDPAAQRGALERFQAALPDLGREAIRQAPHSAAVLERVIGSALVSGFVEAAKKTAPDYSKP